MRDPGVAAGYVKVGRESDRERIPTSAFARHCSRLCKFAEFQSARQVHVWLRDEAIALPVKSRDARHAAALSGDCLPTISCITF